MTQNEEPLAFTDVVGHFNKTERELDKTNELRNQLITRLAEVALDPEIKLKDMGAESRISHMQILKELNSLLKDKDSSRLSRTKLVLANKSSDEMADLAKQTSAILQRILPNSSLSFIQETPNAESTSDMLDKIITEKGMEIPDYELEM